MESINFISRFLLFFRGGFPNLFKKKAHAQEKIGYSWNEWEEKIACHCGRALAKAMNNKILKSTDENINMKFFMCFFLAHTTFLLFSHRLVYGCLREEKFMDQFYGTKRRWNISMRSFFCASKFRIEWMQKKVSLFVITLKLFKFKEVIWVEYVGNVDLVGWIKINFNVKIISAFLMIHQNFLLRFSYSSQKLSPSKMPDENFQKITKFINFKDNYS